MSTKKKIETKVDTENNFGAPTVVVNKEETKEEMIARIKTGNGYADDYEAKYGEEFPR